MTSLPKIPLNKGTLKLGIALSVPVVVGLIFMYSQQEADRIYEEMDKEQKAHPTAKRMGLTNYQLKEVDDNNHVRWQLSAESGEMSDNHQEAELKKVKVEYFDGPTLKMRLIAPFGTANENTKYVKLTGEPGQKVSAQGEEGKAKLEADTVELTKNNQFLASGGVNIEWPEVAKVNGDSASGTIDLSDFKDFKITGNTHALIVVK